MNLIKIKSLKKAYIRIERKDPTQIKATLFFNNQKFSLTWYDDDFMIYDCFSDDEIVIEMFCNEITIKFKKEVNKMKNNAKEALFERAAKTLDDYQTAIDMGFPNYYIQKLRTQYYRLLKSIDKLGCTAEFREFAFII